MVALEQTVAQLDLVAETHRLSTRERAELARIITGAIPGNRDRPLFLLALTLFASGTDDLLSLILPGATGLRRIDTALLDFLVTGALETAEAVAELVAAFEAARSEPDPARAFVPTLSRALHAYRARVLPEARYRNVFAAVRRYLVGCRPDDPWPRDGDAPGFWMSEGRRDFLTRYVTALQALADYAEAARLAASWRETVTLDLAETITASALDETAETSEDSLSPERLVNSFVLLKETPIKVLLANERDALAELGEFVPLVLRWPGDVQAALTLGPVQAAITQALRVSGPPVDLAAYIDKGPSRQDVLDRIDELDACLSACLHLIHQSITPIDETDSARSIPRDVDMGRIATMKRRQGFKSHSVERRNAFLTELIEPVLLMARLLERYKRAWDRLGPERGAKLEQAHREVFSRKLSLLYSEGRRDEPDGI